MCLTFLLAHRCFSDFRVVSTALKLVQKVENDLEMPLPAPQLHDTHDFLNTIFTLSFTLILLIDEGIKTGSYYLSVANRCIN